MHYSRVAERLDAGRVTAYEMLRLLEERGLVRAEYQPKPIHSGPGRSQVLFAPKEESRQVLARLAEAEAGILEDWQALREHLLQEIRAGKAGGYEELLDGQFARLPGRRPPLIFITEFITAVILTLTTISEAPQMDLLMGRLRRLGLPEEIGLNALRVPPGRFIVSSVIFIYSEGWKIL